MFPSSYQGNARKTWRRSSTPRRKGSCSCARAASPTPLLCKIPTPSVRTTANPHWGIVPHTYTFGLLYVMIFSRRPANFERDSSSSYLPSKVRLPTRCVGHGSPPSRRLQVCITSGLYDGDLSFRNSMVFFDLDFGFPRTSS